MVNVNKTIKFYSLAGDPGAGELLEPAGYVRAHSPDAADIIVFNGGADIGTVLYGEKPVTRYTEEFASGRDRYEKSVFDAFKGSKFFFGICRGAQFLNVMNGGGLWQDVDGHGANHDMLDLLSGMTYRATSTHHQMMRPTDDAELIGVSSVSTKKVRDGELITTNPKTHPDLDVEIVWYPKTRSLCVQGHPEYIPGSPYADYCLGLVSRFYKEAKVHA